MALVSGLILFVLAGAICFEVVVRKLFAFSTKATEEYTGYGLAICLTWSIAYTLLERAHVRIDLLHRKISRSAATGLDVVALLAMIVAVILMTVNAFWVFEFNYEYESRSNTTLQTLLWIPQGLWLLGFIIFDMIALWLLAVVAIHLFSSDLNSVQALIGPRGLDEEIDAEIAANRDGLAPGSDGSIRPGTGVEPAAEKTV